MNELTKAEEQIMQVLWKLEKGFVKDILEELPDPKPAYNTVSTIVRILETKGFVGYEAFGRSHRYHPVVSREDYTRFSVRSLVDNYFSGSAEKLVSFFVKEKKFSVRDLDEVLKTIQTHKKK